MPKKRNLPKHLIEEIANKYIEDKKIYNLAKLSNEYKIPYSTLRRYLLNYLKSSDLDLILVEESLPYEGFEYLAVGDTYQWDEHLTIWQIVETRRVDGEKIFILIPTDKKANKHWVCDQLETRYEQ